MAAVRRGKWKDDPMVPIHAGRLRAAMEVQGWEVTELARRLSRLAPRGMPENPQTLHHLSRGDTIKRCRRSRRRRLAKVLEVPVSFLEGGEFVDMPFAGLVQFSRERIASPRLALAVWRLLRSCAKATWRDLGRPLVPEASATMSAAEEAYGHAQACFVLVAALQRWRRRLLPRAAPTPLIAEEPSRTGRWYPPRLEPMEEEAALGLVRAVEFVLQPWISGAASLDYAALGAVSAALDPMLPMLAPQLPKSHAPVGVDTDRGPYQLITWTDDTVKKPKKGRPL